VRGQRIDCAGHHFINRGLVCIAKTQEDGRTVEIGAVGIGGVANLLPFVGIHKTILDVIVQIPGAALRMGCDAMRRELENDKAFRQVVQDYVGFSLSELARHIKVVRVALQDASSVAGLLVTTEAMVAEAGCSEEPLRTWHSAGGGPSAPDSPG
jgi:hypothetical protein